VRAHPVEHVVTGHNGHTQLRQAEFTRHGERGRASRLGMGRAHVGDDAHALGDAGRQHRPQPSGQQQVEAGARVLCTAKLGERDRAFGEAFEHQRVQIAAFGQGLRRVDAVAGITGAGGDAEGTAERVQPSHGLSTFAPATTNGPVSRVATVRPLAAAMAAM
jgi:hypothetical protein